MNEPEPSRATGLVLDRVGRALGTPEGTGPDDSPWLRIQREEARGRTRIDVMQAAMRSILASRGIAGPFRLDPRDLAGVPDEAVIDALLQCEGEPDFRKRLRNPSPS